MDDSCSMAPASGAILPERDWLSVTGGLLLAAASFVAMGYAAYQGWYTQALPHDWAFTGIGFGFLFFALGVFVAGYGWSAATWRRRSS